jgi:hypothetical protein
LLPVVAAVAVWGATAWGFFPPQHVRLVGIVGLNNAPIILSLNSSFQYLGFSLGAALGSVTLAVGGLDYLAGSGGACALARVPPLPRNGPSCPPTSFGEEPAMRVLHPRDPSAGAMSQAPHRRNSPLNEEANIR